jgi:hypothetical protein
MMLMRITRRPWSEFGSEGRGGRRRGEGRRRRSGGQQRRSRRNVLWRTRCV